MGLPLTILDVHRLIDQDVQRLAHLAYKNLETEEIDLHINREIDNLVNGILDKHFGRELRVNEEQGFQKNQVTLDNLKGLHIGYFPVTLVTNGNTSQFTLPTNYYYHIKTRVQISYPCYENGKSITKTSSVDVRIVESQDDFRNNPYHKTGKDSPAAEIFGNTVYIFTDDTFTIDSATITYIRKPVTVKYAKDNDGNYDEPNSVHCDLDSSLHYMLVNMTSLKIMKILESPQQKIVNLQQEIV